MTTHRRAAGERIVALALVCLTGCYTTTGRTRIARDAPEHVASRPNGSHLVLAAVEAEPGRVLVAAEERDMCRKQERGQRTYDIQTWQAKQRISGGGLGGGGSPYILLLVPLLILIGIIHHASPDATVTITPSEEPPVPYTAWRGARTPRRPLGSRWSSPVGSPASATGENMPDHRSSLAVIFSAAAVGRGRLPDPRLGRHRRPLGDGARRPAAQRGGAVAGRQGGRVMRRISAALLTLLSACANGSLAVRPQPPPPPVSWEHPERVARMRAVAVALEPKLEALRAEWKAPGLAVGLVVGGELAWFKGFGERRVTPAAPVDQDTLFRIASMSKAFVSAAVLRLRDEGKVALDEPAERYLPELRRLGAPSADAPRLTVRHLLSHAGGLPEDNATADLRMPMTEAEFDALLSSGLSFSAAPGTQFEYSNLGFALAGRLVSRVSGVPFQEEVRRRLLAPLGMTATGWEVDALPRDQVAVGYGRRGSDMPSAGLEKYADDALHEEPVLHDGAWAALGGLWTTGRDYARWVAFQLAAWPPRDEADTGPVRRASLRESQTVQREYPLDVHRDAGGRLRASAGGYGLGWSVRSTCSFSRVIRHAGGLPGHGSFVVLLPDHGVGVFAMTNLTYTTGAEAVDLLLETLLERGLLPQRPVALSPQLAKARGEVLALMASWDAARATAALDRNYQAYESLDGLRTRLEAVRTAQGRCEAGAEGVPENALRGKVRLACERGEVELSLELTSDLPPRIQALVLEPALPPDARLREMASRVAGLLERWDDGDASSLAAPDLDLGKVRASFRRTAAEHGACGPPALRLGDGARQGTFRLRCERGEVDLSLGLQPASGRLTSLAASTVAGSLRCPR